MRSPTALPSRSDVEAVIAAVPLEGARVEDVLQGDVDTFLTTVASDRGAGGATR
jgi:hypothetical protein